jgi:dTDP-4-dehydrorhamnose reductase
MSISRKRILITGGSGLLGHKLCSHFSTLYETAGIRKVHPIALPGVHEFSIDLLNHAALEQAFLEFRPDYVIHTAGLTQVDRCEAEPELAELLNVKVTMSILKACTQVDAKLIHISTDHLFEGTQSFYTEEMALSPLNTYAKTKAEAEKIALGLKSTLVIRTNFFGLGRPWRSSFSDWLIENFKKSKSMGLFENVYFTPISLTHLSKLLEDLLAKNANGIFNVAGSERISKYDFGVRLGHKFGFDLSLVKPTSIELLKLGAPRPRDMSLSVHKITQFLGSPPPQVEDGLETLTC